MDFLYHYTSLESAIKILCTGELLFSDVKSLNDINESSGPPLITFDEFYDKFVKELRKHKQLSFTISKDGTPGYDIPALWGHYATKGKGVCLVFKKESIEKIVETKYCYSREIQYIDSSYLCYEDFAYDGSIGTPLEYITGNKDLLFCTKSTDWEYEQEYRIITLNDVSINISDSFYGVILYNPHEPEKFKDLIGYKCLSKIVDKDKIFEYRRTLLESALYNSKREKLTDHFELKQPLNFDFSIAKGAK